MSIFTRIKRWVKSKLVFLPGHGFEELRSRPGYRYANVNGWVCVFEPNDDTGYMSDYRANDKVEGTFESPKGTEEERVYIGRKATKQRKHFILFGREFHYNKSRDGFGLSLHSEATYNLLDVYLSKHFTEYRMCKYEDHHLSVGPLIVTTSSYNVFINVLFAHALTWYLLTALTPWLLPFAILASLMLGYMLLEREQGYLETVIGFVIGRDGLSVDFASDPSGMRDYYAKQGKKFFLVNGFRYYLSFDKLSFLKITREESERRDIGIPSIKSKAGSPIGPGTLYIKKEVIKHERFFGLWKREYPRIDIHFKPDVGGYIPARQGKGENSWDCEDELIDNVSVPLPTDLDATTHGLDVYYKLVDKEQAKYGVADSVLFEGQNKDIPFSEEYCEASDSPDALGKES